MQLIRKPENDNGSTDYHPWLTPEVFGESGKGTVNLLGTARQQFAIRRRHHPRR